MKARSTRPPLPPLTHRLALPPLDVEALPEHEYRTNEVVDVSEYARALAEKRRKRASERSKRG